MYCLGSSAQEGFQVGRRSQAQESPCPDSGAYGYAFTLVSHTIKYIVTNIQAYKGSVYNTLFGVFFFLISIYQLSDDHYTKIHCSKNAMTQKTADILLQIILQSGKLIIETDRPRSLQLTGNVGWWWNG